jgi:hypothetical protein
MRNHWLQQKWKLEIKVHKPIDPQTFYFAPYAHLKKGPYEVHADLEATQDLRRNASNNLIGDILYAAVQQLERNGDLEGHRWLNLTPEEIIHIYSVIYNYHYPSKA